MTPPPPSCPMHRPATRSSGGAHRNNNHKKNQEWWPEQLDVSVLRRNEGASANSTASSEYAQRFAKLDLAAVERDLHHLMTSSVDWWPADYGHYGPFFIR